MKWEEIFEMENGRKKNGIFQKFLDFVEWLGNKLPHPVTLFALLAALTLVASAVLAMFEITVEHPGEDQETVSINNLLDSEGISYIFSSMTDNFINLRRLA